MLNEKITPNLKKFGSGGIFQHDNEPKYTATITQEIKKKKRERKL